MSRKHLACGPGEREGNTLTLDLVSCTASLVAGDPPLRGVLRQFGQMLPMTLGRRDDFHLLPVVRKFSAAVQTGHISPGQSRGLGTARLSPDGYWKAVVSVPATKNCIHYPGNETKNGVHQLSNHVSPSTCELVGSPLDSVYLPAP